MYGECVVDKNARTDLGKLCKYFKLDPNRVISNLVKLHVETIVSEDPGFAKFASL